MYNCSKDYCCVVIVSYYFGIIINALILWWQKWKPLNLFNMDMNKILAIIIIKSCNNLLQYSASYVWQSSMFFGNFCTCTFISPPWKAFSPYLHLYSCAFLFFYFSIKVTVIPSLCILLSSFASIYYVFLPLTPITFCHFDKLCLISSCYWFKLCILFFLHNDYVCNNYNDQILYFNIFPFFSHVCIVDKHFMVSYVYIHKIESTIMLLSQTLTGIITITWINECIMLC